MSSTSAARKLIDYLRLQSRFEKACGFSYALGLNQSSVSAIPPDAISFQKSTLKVSLPLKDNLFLLGERKVALSTFLALIDETTTWALVLADPDRSRPGVSVSLRAEWGPASETRLGDEVELISKVNKIGKNLGFVQAEVRDVRSGDLVCTASHVKFMPMGFLFDSLFSSHGLWLAKAYTAFTKAPNEPDPKTVRNLFESFHFDDESNSASFVTTASHANAFGTLHGGCLAIMIELAARHVAGRDLTPFQPVLESLYIEYLSPVSAKSVDVVVQSVSKTADTLILLSQVIVGTKVRCQGTLRFRTSSFSTFQGAPKSRL